MERVVTWSFSPEETTQIKYARGCVGAVCVTMKCVGKDGEKRGYNYTCDECPIGAALAILDGMLPG